MSTLPQAELLDSSLLQSLLLFDSALREGRVPHNPSDSLSEAQLGVLSAAVTAIQTLENAFPRNGDQPAEPESFAIPSRVGRFQVEQVLGTGGFAVVYRAYDPALERLVALKIPRPHAMVDATLRKRFVREAQAAAQLDHPHIVSIYEAGEDGEIPYIAYAYCEGPTLSRWLQQQDELPSSARTAQLISQLANAVQFSHERGILHRDIKPANVLLFPQKSPADSSFPYIARLSDLGLAKLIESGLEDTLSDMVLGTPLYMSPEQAESQHADVGVASDIYSLGAVMYYLLTGRPPFIASGLVDALQQAVERDPIAPRLTNPEVDAGLNTICLKCLEKSPQQRYASARELADDLHRYLAGEPIRARPASRFYRLRRWCRRKPAIAGLLAGVAALLAILMGFAGWHINSSSVLQRQLQDSNVELTKTVRELDSALVTVREQQQAAEVSERYAAQLLYAADLELAEADWQREDPREAARLLGRYQSDRRPAEIREFGWHYLWNLVTAHPLAEFRSDQIVWFVRYSPDGKYLVLGGNGGWIEIYDAHDRFRLLKRIDSQQTEVNSLAFSPDQTYLASAGDNGTVKIWELATGNLIRTVTIFERGHVYGVVFLPGSQQIIACGQSKELLIADWSTGQIVESWPTIHAYTLEAVTLSPDGTRLAVAGADGQVSLWNLATRNLEFAYEEHVRTVSAVAFLPDGRRMVSSSSDGTVRLWDTETGKLEGVFRRTDAVASVAVSSRGEVACIDRGGVLGILELGPAELTAPEQNLHSQRLWAAHAAVANCVAYSPDGEQLVSADTDGIVRVWAAQRDEPRYAIPAVVADADGLMRPLCPGTPAGIVYRCSPQGIEKWDARGTQPLARLVPDRNTTACDFQDVLQQLVVGDAAGQVGVLSLGERPSEIWFPVFSQTPVHAISASASQSWAIAVSKQDDFAICDLQNQQVTTRGQNISAAAIAPHGKWYVVARHGSDDWQVYNTRTGELLHQGDPHVSTVRQLVVDQRSGMLLTASHDRTLRIYDTRDWSLRTRLSGHLEAVESAAISPDGETIASGDRQGVLKLWHAVSGQPLLNLPFPHGSTGELQFATDGSTLYAVAEDGRGQVYDAK